MHGASFCFSTIDFETFDLIFSQKMLWNKVSMENNVLYNIKLDTRDPCISQCQVLHILSCTPPSAFCGAPFLLDLLTPFVLFSVSSLNTSPYARATAAVDYIRVNKE